MLYYIFYTLLKMCCMTSIIALPLLSVKYVFQRMGFPRKITFLLWTVIAFRLICPVSIPTHVSLFNAATAFYGQNTAVSQVAEPAAASNDIMEYKVFPKANRSLTENNEPVKKFDYIKTIAPLIWLVGMCAMLLAGLFSFLRLKKRLRFAIQLKENIYMADGIPTSFVFGLCRPKIFIPDNIPKQDLENMILHEKTHIKRADHILKIAAYILLSAYWFHPLLWALFQYFSNDMELACDEAVMQKLGIENKKAYLRTLLASAVSRQKNRFLYHVCFSGNPTKRRVTSIIKLKPHSKSTVTASAVLCLLAALALGTNAAEPPRDYSYPALERADTNLNKAPAVSEITMPENETADESNPLDKAASLPSAIGKNIKQTSEGTRTTDKFQVIEVQKPAVRNDTGQTGPDHYGTPAAQHTEAAEPADPQNKMDDDKDNIDFMLNVFEDNTSMTTVEQDLNKQGITQTNEETVILGENYIRGNYSYANKCNDTSSNISCDKNGNISVYFDVNAENLVDVTFTDSATQEVVGAFGILASDVNAYSFTGFDDEKTYDITIQGKTEDTWRIEGQYIVY